MAVCAFAIRRSAFPYMLWREKTMISWVSWRENRLQGTQSCKNACTIHLNIKQFWAQKSVERVKMLSVSISSEVSLCPKPIPTNSNMIFAASEFPPSATFATPSTLGSAAHSAPSKWSWAAQGASESPALLRPAAATVVPSPCWKCSGTAYSSPWPGEDGGKKTQQNGWKTDPG